jgi:UDP-N-acetyl-D-mannosaminuronate dehydrogenase
VSHNETAVVLGLGEVGRPLLAILSRHCHAIGVDIALRTEPIEHVDVMHICYPFEIRDFVGETVRYIARFKPALTIINSTVAVGVTRNIAERTGADVVHSPVRGKHSQMQEELHYYTKFIGATDSSAASRAATHLERSGFKTKILSSPEATELGKLSETTYFGVLIAWAQDVERFCEQVGADYDEVISLYEGVTFFPPVRYFPGIIGGHCVMPNIKILSQIERSPLLEAIEASNRKKIEREARKHSAAVEKTQPVVATKVA